MKITSKEALKILCFDKDIIGKIDDIVVEVDKINIVDNLESNNFEFNFDYIQDLTGFDEEIGDYYLLQGHSLGEIDFQNFDE